MVIKKYQPGAILRLFPNHATYYWASQ